MIVYFVNFQFLFVHRRHTRRGEQEEEEEEVERERKKEKAKERGETYQRLA